MRIGLISDTHIPWEVPKVPAEVFPIFEGVDLILHAGDIYSHSVLDDLEKIAPVYAALGDDDYPGDDQRVKERHVLKLEGKLVYLVHEGPYNILTSGGVLPLWWRNVISKDKYVNPDIIVAGHEHRTIVERTHGILYINPGSPTLLHYKKGLGTVGILELNGGEPKVEIIHL
ncbi:MAG TPA: YfcE family phosphodiesterase [Dehalococcoidales bacterium]|nr:YfcE family phosphodiesterase [Dehalococcoidales bacterium]